MTDNDISEAVARIIERGAPDWFIPSYTRQLQMEQKLDGHIKTHEEQRKTWWDVLRPALSMVATAALAWLLLQAQAILSAAH